MRINNPTALLYFIYSARCLNQQAIDALNKFCEDYTITAIKFEDLQSDMVVPEDKALYSKANKEITRTIDGSGGNMAAASDCARILTPIIEQYGISSDFDVESKLSKLGASLVRLRGPVLFPADMIELQTNHMLLTPNSDFLAFSIEHAGSKRLSAAALLALRNLQEEIIRRYNAPFSFATIGPELTLQHFVKYPGFEKIFVNFSHLYPETPTIFDFRTYLSTLPDGPKWQKSAKELLTGLAVINISGPGVYSFLYKHLFPEGCTYPPMLIPITNPAWIPYLALYQRSGTGFYDAIFELIHSSNSVNGILNSITSEKTERLSDKSWTVDGEMDKKEREQGMQQAASVIQRAWRQHGFLANHSIDQTIVTRAQRLCSDPLLLTPLNEKNYALALRRACGGVEYPIVELLLHYTRRHSITIDLNETSTSTGRTALDWIMKARPDNAKLILDQQRIITLLRDAGAMTSEELKQVTTLSANGAVFT